MSYAAIKCYQEPCRVWQWDMKQGESLLEGFGPGHCETIRLVDIVTASKEVDSKPSNSSSIRRPYSLKGHIASVKEATRASGVEKGSSSL